MKFKNKNKEIKNKYRFICDIFDEIDKQIGERYEITKSKYNLNFRRLFFYHNQDRIKYIMDSLNPLRKGTIKIIIKEDIIIISKLDHSSYLIRSLIVAFVVWSFLYLSFELALYQSIIIFFTVFFVTAIIGIFYSKRKIKSIIRKAYKNVLQRYNIIQT